MIKSLLWSKLLCNTIVQSDILNSIKINKHLSKTSFIAIYQNYSINNSLYWYNWAIDYWLLIIDCVTRTGLLFPTQYILHQVA